MEYRCRAPHVGCTRKGAPNYDPSATHDPAGASDPAHCKKVDGNVTRAACAAASECPQSYACSVAMSESRQNVTCSCAVAIGCVLGAACVNASAIGTRTSKYTCMSEPSTNTTMNAAGFVRAVFTGRAGTHVLVIATATEELPMLDVQDKQVVHVLGLHRGTRRRRLASTAAASTVTSVYNGRVAVRNGARVKLERLRIQQRRNWGGHRRGSESKKRLGRAPCFTHFAFGVSCG